MSMLDLKELCSLTPFLSFRKVLIYLFGYTGSKVQYAGSLILVAEYGIQFPDQELTQGPLHWKYGVEPPDHKRSSRIERFIERSKVYSPDYRVDFSPLV